MLPQTKLFLSFLGRRCIQRAKYSINICGKPLGGIFFHPKVQFLMKRMVKVDYDKIFAIRKLEKPLTTPQFTFMTDAELQRERAKAEEKIEYLLQLPPIIDTIEDKIEVLSEDPSLDGHETHHCKMIFTDISLNLKPHERSIVVREPNGILRTAYRHERSRMIQIFYPSEGKELYVPKMFESEHLNEVLKRGDYEFVLDRACLQFDPFEEEYHNLLSTTFDFVNNTKEFEKLWNTRHFGPLAFYLAVNKNIQKMLEFFLNREKIMEASYLINLQNVIHSTPLDAWENAPEEDEQSSEFLSFDHACKSVKDFIVDPSNMSTGLESQFNAIVQKLKESQEMESVILKAHGVK